MFPPKPPRIPNEIIGKAVMFKSFRERLIQNPQEVFEEHGHEAPPELIAALKSLSTAKLEALVTDFSAKVKSEGGPA